jgi:predicted dehydrogenase
MVAKCRDRGIIFLVNHFRFWWEEYRRLQRRISEDVAIGSLKTAFVSCGGARLFEIGSHFTSLALWFAGAEPVSVSGWIEHANDPNPRDPGGARGYRDRPGRAHIVFANGVHAYVDIPADVALPPRLEFVGTRGRVLVEEFYGAGDRWEVRARQGTEPLVATRDYYGLLLPVPFSATGSWGYTGPRGWTTQAYADIGKALAGEMSDPEGYFAPVSGANATAALEMLAGAHESHLRGGMPIPLPLENPDSIGWQYPFA